MTEDKERALLEKIDSCLEGGDLEACVGEAIASAKDLGISPQRLLDGSKIQLDGKHYKQAYVLALAAAGVLDEKAPAYNNAGAASHHLNDLETAEKQYRLAIESDPKLAGPHSNLGNLLKDLQRMDEAEKQYRLAIESDPNHATAHYNLGVLLNDLGRKVEAEEQYRLAIKSDPNHAAAHYNLGVLLDDLGRKVEAEEQYRLAIKSDPNDAAAHTNLGVLLDNLGRKVEAEEQCRLAIKSDPNHAAAHTNLGVLLKNLGRKDEAEEQYRLAIKSDPNLAAAHNNYANLLRDKGWFGEAEKEVRIALDLDPQNPYSLSTLGDILADDGWLDESEKEYKRALEHSNGMEESARSEIHNNLGWVYAQKKLYHNAKDEFFKARTIDPKNVKAIRNLRIIERVESPSEITRDQILISSLLVLPLSLSFYLFWIAKLKETSFTALFMFFTATILFVLLYRGIGKFSAGLKGVEFEMSTEHRLSPAQSVEQITKLER